MAVVDSKEKVRQEFLRLYNPVLGWFQRTTMEDISTADRHELIQIVDTCTVGEFSRDWIRRPAPIEEIRKTAFHVIDSHHTLFMHRDIGNAIGDFASLIRRLPSPRFHFFPEGVQEMLDISKRLILCGDTVVFGTPVDAYGLLSYIGGSYKWSLGFETRYDEAAFAIQTTEFHKLRETYLASEDFFNDGRIIYLPRIYLQDISDLTKHKEVSQALQAHTLCGSLVELSKKKPYPSRTSAEVLKIQLPFLDNVPMSLLAKILKEEAGSYEKAQKAFRKAIEELRESTDNNECARRAKDIYKHILMDGIADLDAAIKKTLKSNAVRMAGGVFAATTVAICAFSSTPVMTTLGAACAASSVVATLYGDYMKDRDSLKTSDLYFLWRLYSGGKSL